MSFKRVSIVGAGVMGEAMIKCLLRTGFAADAITICEKRSERSVELQERYQVKAGSVAGSDLVILAVKPQDAGVTLSEIKADLAPGALLISLLAGVKTKKIESATEPRVRVVRVMPNTPVLLGQGVAAVAQGRSATSEDAKWVCALFATSGVATEVSEDVMDAVTATSGSGPAYFFKFVESMIAGAIKLGLSTAEAKLLAEQTLIGAARMVEAAGKDVAQLRAEVTSPNGTTAAALASLESSNIDDVIFQAMQAARNRSIELSE